MAGLWKLPCVFVCQDNNYGISVNKANSTAVESVADRAASYGMPGVRVTENDPDQVFEAVGEAVARARRGEGPTLLEVKVDRFYGHFQGDPRRTGRRARSSHCAGRMRSPLMRHASRRRVWSRMRR